ncbi:MAG: hypothetical protein LBE81_04195 [Azonexus sp.]|jgi:hypothetical protein|uniref:hypothetical protein n=1 Tax=Azonexus sp. TaxID=1872668 RepID=UPI0028208F60|nr:hypothetical protein [Azonexus sp.]MDR0775823.1 hypothetical protein [Azonexus sp.]
MKIPIMLVNFEPRLFSMCLLLAVLAVLAGSAVADEPVSHPSARLLADSPEWLQPGHCVRYEEGGGGWVMTEPVYYLQGIVLEAAVRTLRTPVCPEVPGKQAGQYSRAEFVRLVAAQPCVAPGRPVRDEQLGLVRLRVIDWETPHARRAENVGRLYRGLFLDQPLHQGVEIELEADLLVPCAG